MQRTKPPFRADHVGSLLRSAALKEARAKREKGEITADAAQGGRGSRDRGGHQEAGGGRPQVDHRRRIPPRLLATTISSAGSTASRPISASARSSSRARSRSRCCCASTGKLGSFSTPSDDRAFQVRRGAHQADAEDDDPVAVVAAFPLRPRRRCRRRSIPTWTSSTAISARATARRCAPSPMPAAAISSSTRSTSPISAIPKLREQVTERGDDPNKLPHDYAGMINAAISDMPADMTIAMHLCRGNFHSTFVASGGYEPVAEILFNEIKIQAYFMEYDTRPRRRLRAAALRAEGQDGGARPRHVEIRHAGIARTSSSAASTRRRSTFRSTSFACRRNAASPRPRRATSSPRTSNGRSCA